MSIDDAPTWEALLARHLWKPHPTLTGFWQRDGGAYVTTSQAVAIEKEEAKGRDRVRKARGQDERDLRKELDERREHWIARNGESRVIKR